MSLHPLSPGGNTLIVLDACVLLPSRLSDVLFDLMLEGLYFTYWTEVVEAEFLRNWPTVHPGASKSGFARLTAFQRASNYGYLITGHEDEKYMARVPSRVQSNDRHLVAAALVLLSGIDEEKHPELDKVLIVSNNIRHLAVKEVSRLGIEVIKAGAFLDRIFEMAPLQMTRAISRSRSDLQNPPYSKDEMLAALRLH